MGVKPLLARAGIATVAVFIGMLILSESVSGAIIYVNGSNTGTEDGLTWATGWNTIQEGINNASTEFDLGGE